MTTLHAASRGIALGHCGTQTHPLGQWPEFHLEEVYYCKGNELSFFNQLLYNTAGKKIMPECNVLLPYPQSAQLSYEKDIINNSLHRPSFRGFITLSIPETLMALQLYL